MMIRLATLFLSFLLWKVAYSFVMSNNLLNCASKLAQPSPINKRRTPFGTMLNDHVSPKADPVSADALERTATHLRKLQNQSSSSSSSPDSVLYREYLEQSANTLKELLNERRLPRNGRKPDLARRLVDYDLGNNSDELELRDDPTLGGKSGDATKNDADSNEVSGNEAWTTNKMNSNYRQASLVSRFGGIKLSPVAALALGRAGFTQPSPIQEAALGRIRNGESVILHAETGSGKTLAYLLPATERLWEAQSRDETETYTVVMTPTRELAAQVAGVASVLAPPGAVRLVSHPTNLMSDGVRDKGERPQGGRFEASQTSIFVGSAKAIMHSLYGDGRMPVPPTNKPEAMEFLRMVRYVVIDEVDRVLSVKKTRGEKQHKSKIHEKPAAVVCAAVARLSLGEAQVVVASATVGRPLKREVARVLGLTPQECPDVVRGVEVSDKETNMVAQTKRAVTIPETVENYVFSTDDSSPGKLLTVAYGILQQICTDADRDGVQKKRVLVVLTRGFGISVANAVGALKHFQCEPEPKSLLDALEAQGTNDMILTHRAVSGADQIGQASVDQANDEYILVTGEDSVRGLHFDNLDTVLVLGRPNGPDEYTHIAGRTGRAGQMGRVISVVTNDDAVAFASWATMLGTSFEPFTLTKRASP